jgi:arylsulfatase A-like enzyme
MERQFPLQQVTQEELNCQPAPYKAMRQHNTEVDHDSVVHMLDPTQEQRHRQRAYYMANVEMIDTKVGEILQALQDAGYLDDAVVVFTSDHGDCLTDHGHSQKWTMYDTITRVPMIVWSPQRFDGDRRIDGLCQQMDIGPALLELAGVRPATTMEARSLLPVLRGDDWQPRQYVFAEHGRDGILQETEFMTMVRSHDWKLVHFVDCTEGQLFDLRDDPGEVINLWDDPAHRDRKRELLDVLRDWRITSDVHTAGWSAAWR